MKKLCVMLMSVVLTLLAPVVLAQSAVEAPLGPFKLADRPIAGEVPGSRVVSSDGFAANPSAQFDLWAHGWAFDLTDQNNLKYTLVNVGATHYLSLQIEDVDAGGYTAFLQFKIYNIMGAINTTVEVHIAQ